MKKGDAYILVKGTIKIAIARIDKKNERHTQVIFKNWTLFADCINKINNMRIANTKDLDIEMPMHNLIEYGDIYSQTIRI